MDAMPKIKKLVLFLNYSIPVYWCIRNISDCAQEIYRITFLALSNLCVYQKFILYTGHSSLMSQKWWRLH